MVEYDDNCAEKTSSVYRSRSGLVAGGEGGNTLGEDLGTDSACGRQLFDFLSWQYCYPLDAPFSLVSRLGLLTDGSHDPRCWVSLVDSTYDMV